MLSELSTAGYMEDALDLNQFKMAAWKKRVSQPFSYFTRAGHYIRVQLLIIRADSSLVLGKRSGGVIGHNFWTAVGTCHYSCIVFFAVVNLSMYKDVTHFNGSVVKAKIVRLH